MLHSTAHDSVEDGVPSVGDRVDLDHLPIGAVTIILREFTEGAPAFRAAAA
jgi:hypothetical protein